LAGLTLTYGDTPVADIDAEISAICKHFPNLNSITITKAEVTDNCLLSLSKVFSSNVTCANLKAS
jgi:hypothetical protein